MKYQTGDKTLKNIGNKLGNITPTMVNRISVNAADKIKALTNNSNKQIEFFDYLEDKKLFNFIMDCRLRAADKFVALFVESNFDIYDFFMALKSKQFLGNGDLMLVNDNEIESIVELKEKLLQNKLDDVKQELLQDIEKDDNVFTVYQNMVSRFAFPDKKRGRPKKVK